MLKRQLGLLIISTILLSPNIVHANETPESINTSVGNVHIRTSDSSKVRIKIPSLNINPNVLTVGRTSIDRNHRRIRIPSVQHRKVIPSVAILRQRAVNKINQVKSSNRVGTLTTRTSTNDSHTVSEQNIQCSDSGSSIIQSSQTINGHTTSSETRTNCKSTDPNGK